MSELIFHLEKLIEETTSDNYTKALQKIIDKLKGNK